MTILGLSLIEIGAIGQFLSFITGLIALIFILKQITKLGHQINGEAVAALYDQMIEIDQFIITHCELKPYIYNNKELNVHDRYYNQVQSLAETMVDIIEHVYLQEKNLPKKFLKAWKYYIVDLYKSSPAIREHLQKHGWYPPEILEDIVRMSGYNVNKKI
jgi:hypothetical protein